MSGKDRMATRRLIRRGACACCIATEALESLRTDALDGDADAVRSLVETYDQLEQVIQSMVPHPLDDYRIPEEEQ